jgi:CRP-like cAMP-binding protein
MNSIHKKHGIIEILKGSSLFRKLDKREINLLYSVSDYKHFRKDVIIINEGDSVGNFFFIIEGKVQLSKKSPVLEKEYGITILHKGDYFGELSIIDSGDQPVTVTTISDTYLLEIKRDKLVSLMESEPAIWNKISMRLLRNLSLRLRERKEKSARHFEEHANEIDIRAGLSWYLLYIIGIMGVYILFFRFLTGTSSAFADSTYLNTPFIFIFGMMTFYIMRKSRFSWEFFGFTTKNWRKNLVESLVWTVFFITFFSVLKLVAINLIPKYQNTVLFYGIEDTIRNSLNDDGTYNVLNIVAVLGIYGLFSPVQEIVARSVLQGCLEKYFMGRYRTVNAIVVSNIIYGIAHVHFSLTFALLVFITGIFWGIIYSRQRSIIGVSFSHILIGYWAFFFLNIQSLT